MKMRGITWTGESVEEVEILPMLPDVLGVMAVPELQRAGGPLFHWLIRCVCRLITMTMKLSAIKRLALWLAVIWVTETAYASQEGALPLSNFRLESNGIGASGKLTIQGKQNEKGQLVELKIKAFGTNYTVPATNLHKLAEFRPNGIRISYEEGYKEVGGKTLYIQFQLGWTSQTAKTALITIFENGKIEVSDTQNQTNQDLACALPLHYGANESICF